VLKKAQVVVDVSNSPSFEDAAVMNFFQTSTGNLLAYEAAAGVGHHVALSIVGSERISDSGYMRAKVAQEKLIKEGPILTRSFIQLNSLSSPKRIADEATTGIAFACRRFYSSQLPQTMLLMRSLKWR